MLIFVVEYFTISLMSNYVSTKLIELGSCAFRQFGATHSHCHLLHGYQLKAKFHFGCRELDCNNWSVDFGGLKQLKQILNDQFDHTLCIAESDPLLEVFQHLHNLGGCNLKVMSGVGIEKTAEWCFNAATQFIKDTYGERCWVERVEVFEHEANSAIYSEPRPITYSTSFTTPVPSTYITPVESEVIQPNNQPVQYKLEDLIPPTTVHPIETPPVPADKPKTGPVPLNGSGVTNGYSGLFDNISWGSR
jgi:6-pyruvoyltetrahydropterin/6-carboxytetrahydropterin synthase